MAPVGFAPRVVRVAGGWCEGGSRIAGNPQARRAAPRGGIRAQERDLG